MDDLLLNEVVWRSVRGPNGPMPAPVRAAFVFQHRGEKNEDLGDSHELLVCVAGNVARFALS